MSRVAVEIGEARGADLGAIEQLLSGCGLSTEGVLDDLGSFRIARARGDVVGAAALEGCGRVALLRSVATRPDWQGRGVATALCNDLIEGADRSGVRAVYLLTESAAGFFRRLGFAPIPREEVEPELAASAQFRSRSCESAVLMVRRLR